MKKIFVFAGLLLSMQLFAQSYPVTGITITIPANPDANTANWKNGTSMLSIAATGRMVNGVIDGRVKESRILVRIKKSGAVACGSFTNASAPASNFNSVSKIWSGNNAVSLLGQECVLPPGDYELCVQFFGEGAAPVPLSEERCKTFTIKAKDEPQYQPPQPLLPANRSSFTEEEIKKPLTFRWTPVFPRPNPSTGGKITYRLSIWQLMEGQNTMQAIKANQPLVTKDVDDLTQVTVNNILTGPCKPPYLCDLAWNVQALNREGKPIGTNNGTSEVFTFSVTSPNQNTGKIALVAPANGDVVRTDPQFTWKFFPTPADYDGDGYFKIKITEIPLDQSPDNAIRTNKPFFEKDSIKAFKGNKPFFEKDSPTWIIFQYPPTAPKFIEGKKYAWKIIAVDGEGRSSAESNAWSFSVQGNNCQHQLNSWIDSIKCISADTVRLCASLKIVKAGFGPNTGSYTPEQATIILIQIKNQAGTVLYNSTPNIDLNEGATYPLCRNVAIPAGTTNLIVEFTTKLKVHTQCVEFSQADTIMINCACNPCKDKKTIFGASSITTGNSGNVSVSSSVTHSPLKTTKVTAQIVDVERYGEQGCLRCTNESKEFGNFTAGTLNSNSGSLINSNKGYSKQLQWKFNTPVSLNNFNYSLQMMFPPLTEVSCCKDSIRFCIRWSFTDENCVTCDTLVCTVVIRDYKKPQGPVFTPSPVYADQIAKMGEPFVSWYKHDTDELPKDFDRQVEILWQKQLTEKDSKISRGEFEENIKTVFHTIRGLRSKDRNADPVWNIAVASAKDNSPNTQCGNGDFETGQLDLNEWSGAYGSISAGNNPSINGTYTPGFRPSPVGVDIPVNVPVNNHSIVSYGNDPVIPALKTTASSSNLYAFRLGNRVTGYGSETLSKKFTVDASGTGIIRFMYALVLQDPGSDHYSYQKPSFWVKVYDASGNPITGKVFLDPLNSSPLDVIMADLSNPFFQVSGSTVYKDWTCARIDLSSYKGQEVTVAMITTDCSMGAHYGYGYIDSWCGNCDGATTGSVNIQPIADSCIKQGTKICVNYTLPKIGTTTGSGSIVLKFYQNGTQVFTQSTNVTASSVSPFCFQVSPSQLPCTNGQAGYDVVAVGNFSITVNGTTTPVTVTSPDPAGNNPTGIKPGFNNDLVCCVADVCCTNFVKQVSTQITMLGNATTGYNTVRFNPTFKAGPKKIKEIRISVLNFETSSPNKECLTCESNAARYGSMTVPQSIIGGGKDAIEGMVYPTLPLIVTCVGCPPAWNARPSSEVIWGSDAGPGYNLMDNTGDQSTSFTISLPRKSTLSCCNDTIRICIKYSFTDVDCRTCDTIICYKIVNRIPVTTAAPFISPGVFHHSFDRGMNESGPLLSTEYYSRSMLRPVVKTKYRIQA